MGSACRPPHSRIDIGIDIAWRSRAGRGGSPQHAAALYCPLTKVQQLLDEQRNTWAGLAWLSCSAAFCVGRKPWHSLGEEQEA